MGVGRTGGVTGGPGGVGATNVSVGVGHIIGSTGAGVGAMRVARTTMPTAASDAATDPRRSLEVDSRIGIFTHDGPDRPETRSWADSPGWVVADML
jgi:hypothetical protein